MAERLYFAYGSNINLEQMACRCPAAEVVGSAVLDGYELLFRGNRSGYGVATVEPLSGSQVSGLLWKLTPECERSLDIYEGYPRLYEKEDITVRTADGGIQPSPPAPTITAFWRVTGRMDCLCRRWRPR